MSSCLGLCLILDVVDDVSVGSLLLPRWSARTLRASVRFWPLALWFLLCGTISLTRFLLDPASFRGGVRVPFIGR